MFKINSCKTLLSRAFSLTSSWVEFHKELCFLKTYFTNNCYPSSLFENIVGKFLHNVFNPMATTYDVPKKIMHISLPFTHNYSYIKRELSRFLSLQYPYVEFRFVFKNPLTIGSLFHFKDSLPDLMRSSIIYLFTCPECNSGKYIGASNRILKVRIDCHKGVSYRTGSDLNNKDF